MGTTIRRQPVRFDIPKSPDYKFLNITNFRGLDISSNPFELATNTASDCLNVYVDETNTLTTRPRLEKKELKDGYGKDILPLVGRCVGIYPLHDGYLFHWSHQMKILHGDKLTDVLVETMPLTPCKCFEQGDKIYLLGEGRYMVIDETGNIGVLKDVEGYVPTRHIVRIDGTVESVESLNLLSDKYTAAYVWDGENNPYGEQIIFENGSKNNAIKKSEIMTDLSEYRLIQYYSDDTCLLQHKTSNELFYGVLTNHLSEIVLQKLSTETPRGNVVKSAEIGKTIVLSDGTNYRFYWYFGDGVWEQVHYYPARMSYKSWGISPNGKIFWYTEDTNNRLTWYPLSENGFGNPTMMDLEDHTPVGMVFTSHQNEVDTQYYVTKTTDDRKHLWQLDSATTKVLVSFKSTNDDVGRLTSDGTYYYDVYTTDDADFATVYSVKDNTTFSARYPKNFINSYFRVSSEKNILYWFDNETPRNLWVAPIYDAEKYYKTYFTTPDVVITNLEFDRILTTSNENLFNLFYWDKLDATISAVVKISPNDVLYADWLNKRKILYQSSEMTRFDNNYWFASGNTYFRSQNNDPTYFPITEYSELGDSNEDITGFNIANDTTLLVYKSNRLYLVQPFHSETTGMTEYSITESKNTVGNTAIDAPIVTTLTEIPLQINNDGIYGLSQVSNVSAVERIADLMSEPINEKWLDIPSQYIENIKTLNRLYWTYVIIPRQDKNNTWVYVLDNRTNSWYYWELPIVTVNAFAKDNRAEFVDTNGDLYYLTTEDIINKAFKTLVTEYYDVGNKLIPWYWQSQILPLGTMNYSKRLVNTTFVLTDTDNIDGYGLNYSFKVFRKLASSVADTEMSGDLNLVRSTTKKTNISRFGFIQLKLSNIDRDSDDCNDQTIKAYRNNKLRLVGLGLKYVLLEGLIK